MNFSGSYKKDALYVYLEQRTISCMKLPHRDLVPLQVSASEVFPGRGMNSTEATGTTVTSDTAHRITAIGKTETKVIELTRTDIDTK